MTKTEFIQIAKSYNLSIGQSIMGPVARYNHQTVMVLWENSLNPALNSVIIFEPERLNISNISTLYKHLPNIIKYFKEKQVQEKLNKIKADFV